MPIDKGFSLLDVVKMRLVQIADMAKSGGWASVFKELAFLHRTAILVEKDLAEIEDRAELLSCAELKVVEIEKNMLSSGAYRFALPSRRLKALHNVERGYGGIALLRDQVIIGDTWYWVSESANEPRLLHMDLRRFGFKSWLKEYVYTFDIFVIPSERKGGISAAFQNSAMLLLRSKGYTKGYGYYWADNIAAHWCTRVTNKWKKVGMVSVSRCLTFTKAAPLADKAAPQMAAGLAGDLLAREGKRGI